MWPWFFFPPFPAFPEERIPGTLSPQSLLSSHQPHSVSLVLLILLLSWPSWDRPQLPRQKKRTQAGRAVAAVGEAGRQNEAANARCKSLSSHIVGRSVGRFMARDAVTHWVANIHIWNWNLEANRRPEIFILTNDGHAIMNLIKSYCYDKI